ncbi:hypothetical protein acdb102_17960 [Acidothermaceae bacterium B102]|nr:hypothetical protein acdb102_17960 [Acidothermaceae bacterium B102]
MIAKRAKAFGAFVYDFVIGDDWVVAAGVVVALALIYVLAHHGYHGVWWLTLAAPAVLLPFSLWRAIRKH